MFPTLRLLLLQITYRGKQDISLFFLRHVRGCEQTRTLLRPWFSPFYSTMPSSTYSRNMSEFRCNRSKALMTLHSPTRYQLLEFATQLANLAISSRSVGSRSTEEPDQADVVPPTDVMEWCAAVFVPYVCYVDAAFFQKAEHSRRVVGMRGHAGGEKGCRQG